MQQFKQHARPKIPQRAQKRRENAEKERGAERGGDERIKPQLAAADAQGEEEERNREDRAVERVERRGEAAFRAAAQAQGAQQVVEQRERHAQQQRRAQQPDLLVDGDAHLSRRRGARAARRRARVRRPRS